MVRRDKTEYLLAQRSRCSLTPARCTAQSASRLSAGALGINTITARRQGELGGLKYEGDSNTQCSVLSEVSSQGNEIMNNVMVSIKPLWVSTPAVHCWSTQSNKTFYLLASADWGWAEQRAAVAVECNCNIAVLAQHQRPSRVLQFWHWYTIFRDINLNNVLRHYWKQAFKNVDLF